MHHFFDVLRRYIDFSGRASRSEFWYFALFYLFALVVATVADLVAGTFHADLGFGWIGGAFVIATLPPMIGVHVRRLHDIGRSGWWVLLDLIPYVGNFALLVLNVLASEPGTNAYGPSPHGERGSAPSKGTSRLQVVAVLGALVVAVVAGGLYWWTINAEELKATARAVHQEGRDAGLSLGENGCVRQALQRHADGNPASLGSSVANSVRLGGCLDTSHVDPVFCEGVPSDHDILAAAGWVNAACTVRSLTGAHCQNLFQAVTRYCASPGRAEKLRGDIAPQSQGI